MDDTVRAQDVLVTAVRGGVGPVSTISAQCLWEKGKKYGFTFMEHLKLDFVEQNIT